MLSNLNTYTGFNNMIIVGEEGTKNYVSKVNKLWDHFITTHSLLVWVDYCITHKSGEAGLS